MCTTGLAVTTVMILLARAVMVPRGKVAALIVTVVDVDRTLEVDERSITLTVAVVIIKTLAQVFVTTNI